MFSHLAVNVYAGRSGLALFYLFIYLFASAMGSGGGSGGGARGALAEAGGVVVSAVAGAVTWVLLSVLPWVMLSYFFYLPDADRHDVKILGRSLSRSTRTAVHVPVLYTSENKIKPASEKPGGVAWSIFTAVHTGGVD